MSSARTVSAVYVNTVIHLSPKPIGMVISFRGDDRVLVAIHTFDIILLTIREIPRKIYLYRSGTHSFDNGRRNTATILFNSRNPFTRSREAVFFMHKSDLSVWNL